MLINERFMYYRAKNNLTQQQLADKLKVTRGLVNRIENGKSTPDKILKIKFDLLERGE